jgi:CheY-like chemotaxis protein
MSIPPTCVPVRFLLVDDNPGDIRLTREALKEGNICQDLLVAHCGADALTMLRHDERDNGAQLPDIILLDVNLPDINGLDLLEKIKTDDRLKRIPVVMLSTSTAEKDICRAYDYHANCYIVKPVGLEQFIEVMKVLENFWVSIVKLPGNR